MKMEPAGDARPALNILVFLFTVFVAFSAPAGALDSWKQDLAAYPAEFGFGLYTIQSQL